ncbi:family 43 glycosylhydrolase [Bacteroides oleiciplenus]|uniref:Uncharacterized protein n=1 Tax=Bacteroides oleiciplenus YIT 12058 TaxID=742727 RepID=K9EF89_9BACE|nr:family 43 glycosylhydrolase [Bacteroides oleiciplenus]EKU89617.1 hypothetical protein HMPREF9447_03055 [Bacteroides oleiciplenus YIT 12058]
MNKILNILAGAILFCIAPVVAQEYPKVIFPGDYPDPSILRDGKDYYMTHSSFSYSPGFLVWHSQDLVNWEPLCRVNGTGMAPDLVKYGGTYYIYFPWGSTNYVVWAKNMKGPWSEPINLKVTGIDPGHIVDEEGNRYLHLSEGTAVKLAKDGLSVIGEPITVYDGWEYPNDWNTECFCLESPKLTYKNGYYYLTSAEGGTAGPATSHMVVSARSKNVMGPWENSPYNPIVHTYSADDKWWSKGHGTLVDDINGNWWIVYHAYAKDFHTLGRSTLIEPIEWTSDGWFRTKSTATSLVTDNSIKRNVSDISDNFNDKELDIRWSTFGGTPKLCTELKGNSLFLQGKGTSPENGRVLLTIPTHQSYETQVEVNLGEKNSGGLLLFYKPKVFAGITCDGKYFTVYTNSEKFDNIPNTFDNHFFLKIINKLNVCSIEISDNGKQWERVADNVNVKEMNHNNYNGFRSLRIALYSAGEGTTQFKDFRYKRID